jgi:hypothetical protein
VPASRAVIGNGGRKWILGVLAVALLMAARADTARAALVPCKAAGGGHYNCQFYVAGDGRTGGAPVQAASGAVVGDLHQGTNWVVCQRTGGRVTSGAYFNDKWAWTLADNLRWGWVNAVYARGGDNDSGFGGGVPACGAAQGLPPGGGAPSPAPIPPAGPLLPAPADEGWKTCRSPGCARRGSSMSRRVPRSASARPSGPAMPRGA